MLPPNATEIVTQQVALCTRCAKPIPKGTMAIWIHGGKTLVSELCHRECVPGAGVAPEVKETPKATPKTPVVYDAKLELYDTCPEAEDRMLKIQIDTGGNVNALSVRVGPRFGVIIWTE